MPHSPTRALSDLGVSIWLDDLSKDRLTSGSLAQLVADHNVVGVTSNPTIFAGAVAGSDSYLDDIRAMKARGAQAEEAVFTIMVSDVQGACDLLLPAFSLSHGRDGRVSLEVSPELAGNTAGTVQQALELSALVDRPNLMIKIPATLEGLPAISAVLAEGISVNVTLIFSIDRYEKVIDAYFQGIEQAQANGHDISKIFSVASFFVSRVDSAVDALLDGIGSTEATELRSRAALANARRAYELFTSAHASENAQRLLAAGGNLQRPLWASTGVKEPALPPTLYVTGLAAEHTVITMPEKTLQATAGYVGVVSDEITPALGDATATLAALEALGISLEDVTDELERDGVSKFVQSWRELVQTVSDAMDSSV
jgi:transaldolase